MEEKLQFQAGTAKAVAFASHLYKMSKKVTILLAEDDENLAFLVRENLEIAGYKILIARDGEEAFRLSISNQIDLYLLDIMMPRKDGFWLAEQIRKRDFETPIVFLTAKNSESAKIEGFMTGADDYITKPFSIKELLLRLTAILKRTLHSREIAEPVYVIGKLSFNFLNRSISIDNQQVKINIKEAEILKLLAENLNIIVPRRTILIKIWGGDDYFLSRSMDVYITRLRKLLRLDPTLELQNIYGTGFKLLERGRNDI
jgi:two-component system, OmpR family, response regulator